MTGRYQTLTSERDVDAQLTRYEEHRPGLVRRRGRWYLDAFGRYWPLPRPRRWLRRAWRRLVGR